MGWRTPGSLFLTVPFGPVGVRPWSRLVRVWQGPKCGVRRSRRRAGLNSAEIELSTQTKHTVALGE